MIDVTKKAVLMKGEGSLTKSKKAPGEIVKEGMIRVKLKTWNTFWAVLKFKHLSFYQGKEKK